jgi:hypothetical protein
MQSPQKNLSVSWKPRKSEAFPKQPLEILDAPTPMFSDRTPFRASCLGGGLSCLRNHGDAANPQFRLARARFPVYRYAMETAGTATGPVSWERMSEGIEKVKDRLKRAAGALDEAGIEYAVIGGNAVAAWVSRVDDSVVRNTRDVDLLVRRGDMPHIIPAMEKADFIHRTVSILGGKGHIEIFLDGPEAKARDAVHLIFADEKVSEDSIEPSPAVSDIDPTHPDFRLIDLLALVTMKLTSYRDKDRVHLRDMMEIGQLDASWLPRVPPSLRQRLQDLLDDPDG